MTDKKIYYKLIPRADEHNALLVNVQADKYLDLTMLGLSRLCNIKQYQSHISNLTAKRKYKTMERKIASFVLFCFGGNLIPHTQKSQLIGRP